MARPIRIEYENAFYHVTARGNARCKIFRDDYDRDLFLEVVKAAYDRFGFIIHAFVLMDNHYHFLIETPHANLSASMRHINGRYTQKFNKRHKVVGHLFQGRYKAFVVDHDAYYLELVRYIHLNPWRANMVKQLDSFRYSGHRAIIDKTWAKRWQDWYDRDIVLAEFGRREGDALRRYREFVNAGKGMDSPLGKAIGGYAVGDRGFADWLWKEFIEGKDKRELIGSRTIKTAVDVSDVVSAVGKAFGIGREYVFSSRRGRGGANVPRGMALHILHSHTGLTQVEVGRIAGDISRNAVSEAIRGFKELCRRDANVEQIYARILKSLK